MRLEDDDDFVEPPRAPGRKSASHDGFDLHSAVGVGADDDVARERLARYCARTAFALERLSVLSDGRIAYALKSPRRGATHRVLTPVELLARIAALVPPPRHPFLRYHGVLAPASKWRGLVVPSATTTSIDLQPCAHRDTPHAKATQKPSTSKSFASDVTPAKPSTIEQSHSAHSASRGPSPTPRALTAAHLDRLDGGRLVATAPRLDWVTLLRRTFAVDVLVCPQCHGRTRIVAAVTAPAALRRILTHLRHPPARAPPSGAREPMFEDDWPCDST